MTSPPLPRTKAESVCVFWSRAVLREADTDWLTGAHEVKRDKMAAAAGAGTAATGMVAVGPGTAGTRAAFSADCTTAGSSSRGGKSAESRDEEPVSAQRQLASYRKHLRKVKSVDFDASVEKEPSVGDPCPQAEPCAEQPAHGTGAAAAAAPSCGGSAGAILMDIGAPFR